jgi:hypothetical protein
MAVQVSVCDLLFDDWDIDLGGVNFLIELRWKLRGPQ